MLTHHTLECAKERLNPESHWLVNGSFLLTENFVKIKNYKFVMYLCEPFLCGALHVYFGAP